MDITNIFKENFEDVQRCGGPSVICLVPCPNGCEIDGEKEVMKVKFSVFVGSGVMEVDVVNECSACGYKYEFNRSGSLMS